MLYIFEGMIIVEVEYVLARKILQLANQIIRNRNEDLKGLGLTAEQADALALFPGAAATGLLLFKRTPWHLASGGKSDCRTYGCKGFADDKDFTDRCALQRSIAY